MAKEVHEIFTLQLPAVGHNQSIFSTTQVSRFLVFCRPSTLLHTGKLGLAVWIVFSSDLKAYAWQPGAGQEVGRCWAKVGLRMRTACGHVGPMLKHAGPIFALCWPMFAVLWPILDVSWPMLVLCFEVVYNTVEESRCLKDGFCAMVEFFFGQIWANFGGFHHSCSSQSCSVNPFDHVLKITLWVKSCEVPTLFVIQRSRFAVSSERPWDGLKVWSPQNWKKKNIFDPIDLNIVFRWV